LAAKVTPQSGPQRFHLCELRIVSTTWPPKRREIMLRWPNTLTLPIMPTGAIPLHRDLVRMPGGYIVNPSEAHKYQLEPAQKESPNK
jgi:hypothetical protein